MKNVCLLLFIGVYLFSCFASNDIQKVRIEKSDRVKLKKVYKVRGFKPLHIIFDGFDVNSLVCLINNDISLFLPGNHTLVNYNNLTAVLQTPGLRGFLEIRFECAVKSTNAIIIYVDFYIKTVGNLGFSNQITELNMFNEVLADRILSAVDGKPLQIQLKETSEYEEDIISPVLTSISCNFNIDTKTNETITCTSKNVLEAHTSPENKNDVKVNSETEIHEIIPETQSKALEIIGIVIGFLLAVLCAFCYWRLRKRAQVTKDKLLSRSAGDDNNRIIKELTDRVESPKYEYIESNNNTHPDALNANAPDPPPRSALPSKNTRLQIPPRGGISHREMEQCRYSTNQRSGLKCTHVENEYDYVYVVKKQCPCVATSNRGAGKHLQRNGGSVIPHRVPAHQ